MLHYKTMAQLKQMNRNAGRYYFSRDTMRFFNSRVSNNVYTGTTGWYFVTSERMRYHPDYPRLYSVCKMSPDGSVSTIGEFQGYATRALALGEAKRLAEKERKAQ